MGRVGRYNKYLNFFKYGAVVEKVRKINLYHKNLKRIIKRESGKPYSFSNILPLPVNKISRIIGVFPMRVNKPNYNKSSYNQDYSVRHFLESQFPEFLRYLSGKIFIVLPGDWKYSFPNLVTMSTPHLVKYGLNDIIAGYRSRVGVDLVMPIVPRYETQSILGLGVNGKAYPGVMTSKLIGPKRNRTTSATKTFAHQYSNIIINKTYVLDKSLTYVGGREKRNKTSITVPFKQIATRVTLAQEDVPTLIGQSVAKTFNESMQKLEDGFNWGGRLNGRSNFRKLIDVLSVDKHPDLINFSTDFSSHDANVSEEQIVVAFGMIRLCFPECHKLDKLFYYIMSGMIFKRIVLPESRFIYEITKGVATGHSFTSIITTLCAYGTISTAISKIVPPSEIHKTHLQGAGDDWNGVMPEKYLDDVSHEINTNSGSKCDNLRDLSGDLRSDKLEGKPTFLKKTYMYGLLGWNDFELFINLMTPTSKKMNLTDRLGNYLVMAKAAPFNFRVNMVVEKLAIMKVYEYYIDRYCRTMTIKSLRTSVNSKFDAMVYSMLYNTTTVDLDTLIDFSYATVINGVVIERINVKEIATFMIVEHRKKMIQSHKWMLTQRDFLKYETNLRLRVFDTKKTHIIPMIYYIHDDPYIDLLYDYPKRM